MKCPKCGYIGFEQTDRCRNCGYDFVLAAAPVPDADLPLRRAESAAPFADFDLGEAASPAADAARGRRRYDPDLVPRLTPLPGRSADLDLPLFDDGPAEEAPIVPAAAAEPPLAVRRSTPPAVRTRPRTTPRVLHPAPETRLPLADAPPAAPSVAPRDAAASDEAPLGARFLAGCLDWALLLCADGVVVYFTLKICRLDLAEFGVLPLPPLVAFLVLLNGGYLALLTAAGGQTLGKMAFGLRVVGPDDASVPIGRAIARALVFLAGALAAGIGLLPLFFTSGRRGVHDLAAGTRVIPARAEE